MRALCPVLVGRDQQVGYLLTVLDAAAAGEGATVVIRGEAGIGKSRLAAEVSAAARSKSMSVLVGRGSPHGQAPYRPFTEALFAVARAGVLPEVAELKPFRHALGSLVPDWQESGVGGEQSSSVVIGEAVLRLARVLGQGSGTLLLIEDMQWADADTLAVVEYLADNIAQQPVLLLLTVRAEERSPALDLVSRLQTRRAAAVVDLERFGPIEVAAMVAATSTGAGIEVAAEVVGIVSERSEGVPEPDPPVVVGREQLDRDCLSQAALHPTLLQGCHRRQQPPVEPSTQDRRGPDDQGRLHRQQIQPPRDRLGKGLRYRS